MPRSVVVRRSNCLALIVGLSCVVALASRAQAVGWGPTDFLITGAPNFPDRIGVFDQSFAFKGYLDQNFLGVQGMDFDAQGNLVAQASLSTNPEVRVYSPSGTRIGGFFTNNPSLQFTGDLKVAPDGNYAFGSFTAGVQVYTPGGTFVRQYGSGDSRGITYLPGNRLWSGGAGTTVHVFDMISGAQVGTFTADQQTMSYSMQYSAMTNTVLVVDADRDLGGVFERALTGTLLHQFHVPIPQTDCTGATRGPGGHVFGTTDDFFADVVDWRPDGPVARTIDVYPVEITPVRILWAGLVPEPQSTGLLTAITALYLIRTVRSRERPRI